MEKEIILEDKVLLVSETDEKGIIRFANNDFCKYSGYKLEELVGQPHNIVRHPDMPNEAFKDLWNTVKSGNIWSGFVKNYCKGKKEFYWVYATVFPFTNSKGESGFLSCRKKISTKETKYAETTLKRK